MLTTQFLSFDLGDCTTHTFGYQATAIFHARSYNVVDKETARGAFAVLAAQIGHLGQQLQRGQPACDLHKAGRVPCDLLDLSRDEEGCQIVQRLVTLLVYISDSCNEAWIKKYDAYVQELEIAAQPADGSECPLLGDLLERHEIRDMNQQHAEEFDRSIEETLSEAKIIGNEQRAKYREIVATHRQAAQKRRQTKQEMRKQKNEDAKKLRFEARVRSRLDKRRQAAERRLEEAKLLVDRELQELERVEMAVENSDNGDISMLFDTSEDIFIEEEEPEYEFEEEFTREIQNLFFGEPLSQSASLCTLPGMDRAEDLTNHAMQKIAFIKKFNEFARSRLMERVESRFEGLLKYVFSSNLQCEGIQVNCDGLAVIFGRGNVEDIDELLEYATELVSDIEQSCQSYSFSEFYVTIDGRVDKFL
ncbi:unnamed protein product [Oikopleura dioica]|uniref:Uncharacterized protein n=1 Tax=Oikopleura dioica TaxID=34765 RepID=E4Y7N4_OIKDI|nr:unnamed protein product [Oikopleura dioica]